MCGVFGRGGWLMLIGGRGADSDAPRPPSAAESQPCNDNDDADDDWFCDNGD